MLIAMEYWGGGKVVLSSWKQAYGKLGDLGIIICSLFRGMYLKWSFLCSEGYVCVIVRNTISIIINILMLGGLGACPPGKF